MKKLFVLILILAPLTIQGVCCPPPYCKDGTGGFWNCGAGPGKPFWPGGCFFLTGCGCKKCKEPKTMEQCLKYCQNVEIGCEDICYGEPSAEAVCIAKCQSEQDVCDNWCESQPLPEMPRK